MTLSIYIAPGTVDLAPISVVSKAEARDLFTFDEKKAIESSTDAGVRVYLQDMAARDVVDLKSPKFAAGLAYLVGLGLLTEARATAIKNNESPE